MYQSSIARTTTVVVVLCVITVETGATEPARPPPSTTPAPSLPYMEHIQTQETEWLQKIDPEDLKLVQEALKGGLKKEHILGIKQSIENHTNKTWQKVHQYFRQLKNATATRFNVSEEMNDVANQTDTLLNATESMTETNSSEKAENVRRYEEKHRQFENELWRDIYITSAIVPRLEASMETITSMYCQNYSPMSDLIELTCSAIQLGTELIKTSKFIQAQLETEKDPHTVTVLQELQKNLTRNSPIASGTPVVQTALIATDLIMNMMWLSPLFKNATTVEKEVPIYVAETVYMATTSQEPLATLMAGTAKWIHALHTDPDNFAVTYTGLADILNSLHEHETKQHVSTDDQGVHHIDVSDHAANSEPLNNEYWLKFGHEIAEAHTSETIIQVREKSLAEVLKPRSKRSAFSWIRRNQTSPCDRRPTRAKRYAWHFYLRRIKDTTPTPPCVPMPTPSSTRSPRVKRFAWWLYRQVSPRAVRRLRHWGGRARRVMTSIRRSKAIRQTVAAFNRVKDYVTSSLSMLRDPYSPTRRNFARLSTSLANTFQKFKDTWDTTFRRGDNRQQSLEDAVNDYMQTPEFHRQMSIRFGAITNSEFEPIFNKLLDLATSQLEKILEKFVEKLVASFKKSMADALKEVRKQFRSTAQSFYRSLSEMTKSMMSQISNNMDIIKEAVHEETEHLMEITLDLAGKAGGGSGWDPISAFFNFLSSAADLGGKVIESKMKYVNYFHGTTKSAFEKVLDGLIPDGGAVLNKISTKKTSRKRNKSSGSDSDSEHPLPTNEGGATGRSGNTNRRGNTNGDGRPKSTDEGAPSGSGNSGTSGPKPPKKEIKKEDPDLIDLDTEALPPGKKKIIPSSKSTKAPTGPQGDDTQPLSPQPAGGTTRVVKKEDPIVSHERQHEIKVKTDPTRENQAGNPAFPNPNDAGGANGGRRRTGDDRTRQNEEVERIALGANGGPNTGNVNGANQGFGNPQVINPTNNPFLHDDRFVPDEYGLPRMVDSEGRMAVTPVHGETGLPVFRILRRGLEPNRFFYPDQDDFSGSRTGARRRPDYGQPRRQDLGEPPAAPNFQRGQDRGPPPPLPDVPPRNVRPYRNRNNNNDENIPLGPVPGNAASQLDPHAPSFQPGSHSGSPSPHSAHETAQLHLRHPSTVYADGVEYRHNGRTWVNHNGQMRPVDITNTASLRPDLHHYLGDSGPPNAVSAELLSVFDSYLETQQSWFRVAGSQATTDIRYQNMLNRHSVELQRIFLENPALQTIQRHPPPGVPPQIWNDVIWGDFNHVNPSISRNPNPYTRDQRVALFRDHIEQMHRYIDHLTHHTRSSPDPRDPTGRTGRANQQFRIAHQRIGGPVQERRDGSRQRWLVQPIRNNDPNAQQINPYHSLYHGPQLRTSPLLIDPSVGSTRPNQPGRQSPNGRTRVLAENDANRGNTARQDAPNQRSSSTNTETGPKTRTSSPASKDSGAATTNNKQRKTSKSNSDPDVNTRSRSKNRKQKSDGRTSSLPESLQKQPGETRGAYYARRGEALPDETLRATIADLLQPRPRKATDLTMDLSTISAVRNRRRNGASSRGTQTGSTLNRNNQGKSTPDINNNVDDGVPIAGSKLGRFTAAKTWMEKSYAKVCPKETWGGSACRVLVNGGLVLGGIGVSTVAVGATGDAIMCQLRTECRMGPTAYEQMLTDERNATANYTLKTMQQNMNMLAEGQANITQSNEDVAQGLHDVVNVTTGQQFVLNHLASKSLDPAILENLKVHGYIDPTFIDRFVEKQVGAIAAAHDIMKAKMANATWTIERQEKELMKLRQNKVLLLRYLKKRKDSMSASDYHFFMSDTLAKILLNKFPRQYITEDFMTAVYHSYIDEIHAIPEFEDYDVDDFIYLWNTTGFPFKNQRLVSGEETNSTFRITAPQLLKVGGKVYEKVEYINDQPIAKSNDSTIMFEDADGTVETYKENELEVDYSDEEQDYAEDYFGNIDDYADDVDAGGYVSPKEKEQLPLAITQFVIQDSHDNYYDDKAHATKYLFIGLAGAIVGAVVLYLVMKRVFKANKAPNRTEWKEMQPLQRPPTYEDLYY